MELPPLHMPAAKRCTKCFIIKDFDDFSIDKSFKDGKAYWCRLCVSEKNKTYSLTHKEEERIYNANYRRTHLQEDLERSRNYRRNHLPEVLAYLTGYRKTHHEELLIKKKEYYAANKEEIYLKISAYRVTHRDLYATIGNKRRAQKTHAAINDLSHAQWIEIQEHFSHCCAYCDRRMKGHLTQDHVTPLSKGGNHTMSNIVPACKSCNSKKSDGLPLRPVQPLLITVAPPRSRRTLHSAYPKQSEEAAD